MDAPVRKSRGIQSVEIGLGVLSALAACRGPAGLSAVAQASGLSASQAHRYLASLIAAGMAKQDPGTGLYDLDSGAIRIGLAGLARLDVFVGADAAVAAYIAKTGRTCLVAVWGDAGATVVRWFPGHPPVVTSLAVGSILPLLHSATGHLFYTFGDRFAMDARAREDMSGNRAAAALDLEAIKRQVRARMFGRVDGDLIPGLRVVSAPVFDLQGRMALAITSIASPAIDREGDADAEAALIDACRDLTLSLGGRWPAADRTT
jgi:DNA-binding IclR family transcriptional regulator